MKSNQFKIKINLLSLIFLFSMSAGLSLFGVETNILNNEKDEQKIKTLLSNYSLAIKDGNNKNLEAIFHNNSVSTIDNNAGQTISINDLSLKQNKNHKLKINELKITDRTAVLRIEEDKQKSFVHLLKIKGKWNIVSKITSNNKQSKENAQSVMSVLKNYEKGTRNRDIDLLKSLFHKDARMSGYIGRHQLVGSPQPFFDFLWANSVAPNYTGEISDLIINGNTASARIYEENLFNMSFINDFHLVKKNNKWQIVSKLFHHGAPKPSPYGSAFRSVTDNMFSKSGIEVYGWAEATYIKNNNNSKRVAPQAFFNTNEGLNLNQIGLALCKGDGCIPAFANDGNNVIGRVTATPGPKGEDVRVGFNVTLLYGEDVGFFRTSGIDDGDNYGNVTEDDRVWAIPQAYLDIYLPLIGGTNVMIGSFQTSLGNQIGYPFSPPNWFVTKQNAFVAGPAKHVGILAQTKLPIDLKHGIFSVDYGVVKGWNNYENKNEDYAYMLAARWRSNDMRTWVDLETIFGNGENEFGAGPGKGGSQYFALSSKGEKLNRTHTTLTILNNLNEKLEFAFQGTYGTQKGGDIKGAPFFIVEDSKWYGASLSTRYTVNEKLKIGARAEWFKDEKGANILYHTSPGAINSLTLNASYQLKDNLVIRPEIRHDRYKGNGIPLYGDYNENSQTIGMINTVFSF